MCYMAFNYTHQQISINEVLTQDANTSPDDEQM